MRMLPSPQMFKCSKLCKSSAEKTLKNQTGKYLCKLQSAFNVTEKTPVLLLSYHRERRQLQKTVQYRNNRHFIMTTEEKKSKVGTKLNVFVRLHTSEATDFSFPY